ncbi:MAG: hypothetical protein ABR863_03065 [Roseiarcus sp.]|jgi:hypothetical protein
MNAEDYAALPTDRLLELFADAAKRFGLGSSQVTSLRRLRDSLAPPAQSPKEQNPAEDLEEQKSAAAQLWATSAVLKARRPIAQVERMLEDDDPDIRATTAMFLGGLSPELAEAATESYLVEMPTREVLALQRRARQAPPERPTLEEMSDDELVARFEDAALRESGAGFLDYLENPADKDVQNRIVSEVWAIMRQLKARGLLARLLPLFASDNVTVRREAATACLRTAEAQAIGVLEEVARNRAGSREGFEAGLALVRWRKDGSIVYGV